ncbi:hypothetical protein BU17DRAFT_36193 [Hysterangium stoloniferum]|nr:hypothetical protein BU17DRAFT_36193 [Hysterangium stoloniferum]
MWTTVRATFGYGPEGTLARKELVSLLSRILFSIAQVAAIIALSIIAAVTKSPTQPDLNEWQACRRPLGAWSTVWSVRVVFVCIVTIWTYQEKQLRNRATEAYQYPFHGLPILQFRGKSLCIQTILKCPFSGRLSSLLSLLSAVWFIVAHVLLYSSANSCRVSSPHLWWLTFGIIGIGYLVILEVVFVVVLVFFIGPLLFLIINLVLICLGREPLRQRINPEVGKLSAKAVDSIPLVLYIPAPTAQQETDIAQNTKLPTITAPEAAHVHSYPPDTQRPVTNHNSSQGTRVQSRSRRLFTFRRVKLKRHASKDGENDDKDSDDMNTGNRYEDKWEKGDYPFVKLEENRTTCAICLCDFEEPKRVRYSIDSKPPEDLAEAEATVGINVAPSQDDGLRLADPGEGAQPLRLLECAHVFHKTCVDPWLIEVSGRCPVCQKPVEVKEPPKSRRSRRRDRSP